MWEVPVFFLPGPPVRADNGTVMNTTQTGSLLNESISRTVIEEASELAREFSGARPFRHVCIDGFFAQQVAARLAETFPPFDERLAINENGEIGAKAVHEKIVSLGPDWERLDKLVQDREFRALISRITGIPDLRYDPYYFGGGTHENLHGQSLDAHVDFNFHPVTRQHRRLNLIVYLTEEWREEWGGSIQLHRDPYLPPEEDEVVTITPAFNRCVIFETNEHSWHGFPRIELPEDKRHLSRRSFALYYYTETRPAEELGPEHSTIYVDEHLPDALQPGAELDAKTVEHVRNLVARRDQHLKRLYRNIERLNTELNQLREERGVQTAPGVAPEPASGETDQTDDAMQLAARLERREAEIRRLAARVRELESSTSWRVTRPLRHFRRMLARRESER